jgi:hypothetical protein
MVDVFISYSRSDNAMVAMLARAVEGEGYDVWWDAELPPHQSYGDVITEKIATARAAIVVWSADAVKSEWVRAEADMARNQKKLVQTALGPIMPPLPFNQIQFAEIGDWRGEPDHPGWRKVKASLADLCGKREPVAGAPAWTPPPPPAAVVQPPAAPPAASKAPLFAGIAIAAVAIAVAGGFVLGQRKDDAPVAAVASPSATATLAAATDLPEAAPAAPSPSPVSAASVKPEQSVAPVSPAPAATARPGDTSGMIFAQSSVRMLSPAELQSLTPLKARLARNEIYARHGRRFADPYLQKYFAGMSWYAPTTDEVDLSEIELANVAALRRLEVSRSAGAVR